MLIPSLQYLASGKLYSLSETWVASLESECTADSARSVSGAHASLALGVGSGELGCSMYQLA